jgi:RNA polymerase sigma-70 factor (ECF subfamily)
MPDSSADSDLIAAAQSGALPAFAELVRRYQGGIRTLLGVRLGNYHEAEDLAQEVFVTAFRRLETFDPAETFGPWLRGIAFNLLRNHQRKFRAHCIGGDEELAVLIDQRAVARFPLEQEPVLVSALRRCLERLSDADRLLLRRRYDDENSVGEIARTTGRGQSAVTMHLFRLRQALADCIRAKLEQSV